MILIISNKWDLTVDYVIKELRRRKCSFLRLNTEDLVADGATIELPELRITVAKQENIYDLLDTVNVIWNRRLGKPFDGIPLNERPSSAVQQFVNDQWFSWLEALQLIPEATWINHPRANDLAENKIHQLHSATELGFRVPRTLISNNPDAIRMHVAELGNSAVVKALYSPLIEEPEQDYFVHTNAIDQLDLVDDNCVRLNPSIFQELIKPKTDYRVTVVGETVMAARIESAGDSGVELDWRTQKDDLEFVACSLPHDVENLCRRYVRKLGLLFGAVDLVERYGDYFFLEINPNGEWGWLQKPHGFPIAEALCDLMVYYNGLKQNSNV